MSSKEVIFATRRYIPQVEITITDFPSSLKKKEEKKKVQKRIFKN